jgi:chemotaxis protein CheY-P-specific phosphatase CheC
MPTTADLNKKFSAKVASAMSQWLGTKVNVLNSKSEIVNFATVENKVLSGSVDYTFVYEQVLSKVYPGIAWYCLTWKDAFLLTDILSKKTPGTTQAIDKKTVSALKETANLLIGTYLNEFAKISDQSLLSSKPYLLNVMGAKKILNQFIKMSSKKNSKPKLLSAEFEIVKQKVKIKALIIVPSGIIVG